MLIVSLLEQDLPELQNRLSPLFALQAMTTVSSTSYLPRTCYTLLRHDKSV